MAPNILTEAPAGQRSDDLPPVSSHTAARGVVAVLLGQWGRFATQILAMLILARLISPANFGVYALATPFVGIAELLRDAGLVSAVVQARRVSHENTSNLFWLNLLISLLMTTVLWLVAPELADFFHQPELTQVLRLICFVIPLNALATMPQALLNRDLRFTRMAAIEASSGLVGLLAGLLFALRSHDYMALVVQQLTYTSVRCILLVKVARFTPGRIRRGFGTRAFVVFGLRVLSFNLLTFVARSADNLVIGRQFGSTQLGLYGRAYNLLLLPLQQINAPLQRVAIPTLSRSLDDKARFEAFFLLALRVSLIVCGPLFAITGVMARPLFLVFFGPEWVRAGDYFSILAVAGYGQCISQCASWVFMSTGQVSQQVRLGLITRPLIVASFFVGALFGPMGVVICYASVSIVVDGPATLAWATMHSPVRTRAALGAAVKPLLVALACGATTWLGTSLFHSSPLAALTAGSICGLATLAGVVALDPRLRADIRTVRQAVRRSSTAQASAVSKSRADWSGK